MSALLRTVALGLMPLALAENGGAQTAADAAPLAQIIRQCVQAKWQIREWKIRAVDKNGPLPVVKMRLRFRPDGTLAAAPVIANPQDTRLFQATSNSAAIAVEACTPFRLPPAKYELWKDIILTFDPREIPSAPAPTTVPPGEGNEGMMRPPGITHSAENDNFGRAVIRAMRETMPGSNKAGRVSIKLIISDSGRLQEMHVLISSGDADLDRVVLSAAAQTRFPKPTVGATLADRTFVVNYVYR